MVGIYLSGTGNTKHCVEKLVSMLEDTAKIVPLENTQITNILEQQDVILLWYAILLKEMLNYGEAKKYFV